MKKNTTETFIQKARAIHGDYFGYSSVKYIDSRTKIIINCPNHGDWLCQPRSHLTSKGCPKCKSEKRKLTTENFIAQAENIHGNRYDYSKSNYITYGAKIIIICHKHGEFLCSPAHHLKSRGCPKCKIEKLSLTTEIFITRAKEIHNNKYDYSKTKYVNTTNKIIVICPNHGEFLTTPRSHLQKRGCIICAGKNMLSLKEFIIKANKTHNNRYDYSKVAEYKGIRRKIIITCPKHGEFTQTPEVHLNGHGCKKCAKIISKMESKWLDSVNIPKEWRDKRLKIGNKTIIADGFNPDTNTIYEFNGDYWHGNPAVYNPADIHPLIKRTFGEIYNQTLEKEKLIKEAGFNLVVMWEHDFTRQLMFTP